MECECDARRDVAELWIENEEKISEDESQSCIEKYRLQLANCVEGLTEGSEKEGEANYPSVYSCCGESVVVVFDNGNGPSERLERTGSRQFGCLILALERLMEGHGWLMAGNGQGPKGLSFQLWPAATSLFSLLNTHRLHRHLPLHPHRRIRILELGSGTGLVGITAAAILGADVTVTDLPHVIPNLEFNVAANGSIIAANGGAVVAAELAWGDVDQMETIGREYDVIVGSDVVYHDHLYEPLLNTLKFLLVKDEMVFLMAHLKRWKKETVFFRKAKKLFEVDVIIVMNLRMGKELVLLCTALYPTKAAMQSFKSRFPLFDPSYCSRMLLRQQLKLYLAHNGYLKATKVQGYKWYRAKGTHVITGNFYRSFPLIVEFVFNLLT
ncbi:Protein-lysine methyltransferase METTL21C [Bienertia sinuspersici]